MKKSLLALLLALGAIHLFAQKNFNAGFEQYDPATGAPAGWISGVGPGAVGGDSYEVRVDSGTVYNGRYSCRLQPGDKGADFGSVFITIPADFEAKKITLKGFIKTQNVSESEGWAGLWLRIDSETSTLAFDNMYQSGAHGTSDWKEYSITLDNDDESKNIRVGCLLAGPGTAWFDNISVLADGKPLLDAPTRQVKVYGAELDTTYNQGSQVKVGPLTPDRIEQLALLGQVWGLLKYYHPAVAAGQYNWDYELFRMMPAYLAAKNNHERTYVLVNWIETLGAVPDCADCKDKPEGELHIEGDFSWIKKQDKALRKTLEHILNNSRPKKNYYVTHDPNIGNPKFLHENSYRQFSYPDEGFRLLALYRYWNTIQYFFPYRDVIGENWNEVLRAYIPKMLEAPDALSYKLTLRELIGRIHDTHANLWVNDAELRHHFGDLRPAVQIKFVENEAVVTGYYHAELGPKTGLLPGDLITAIDGVPVQRIVEQKIPMYPASNLPTKMRDIAKDLLRSNNPSLRLDVRRGNQTMQVQADCLDARSNNFDMNADWAWVTPDSCYRLINPKVGYLNLGVVKQNLFSRMFRDFEDTKGIIIDIRNYPAEFVVFSLNAFLKCEPSEFVYFTAGSVEHPGFFTKTPKLSVGEQNTNCYQGKVIVLVNEMSQSQAEYTAMALRSRPGTIIVGSTTAGADGNVSEILLPGGMRSMISGIGVFYPDGTPTQRVGIVPDHTVRPTIEGIRAGRDEVLEYAIRLVEMK